MNKALKHYHKNSKRILANQKKLRKSRKQELVTEFGGKCQVCEYDRLLSNLVFHHIDPTTKLFTLSERGLCHNKAEVEAEAKKCVLLCCRCHGEVHGKLIDCPKRLQAPVAQ